MYNYSCVFGKRNYRVLVRVCVCVCVKLEYVVVYENIPDKFDIEHGLNKVKVTVGLQYHNTNCQVL